MADSAEWSSEAEVRRAGLLMQVLRYCEGKKVKEDFGESSVKIDDDLEES